ncbi:hypothetical protein TURU_098341 [Turdus rufiventris]|nr:hypothetical protein TURU_098341 [Turdus rufiventris]
MRLILRTAYIRETTVNILEGGNLLSTPRPGQISDYKEQVVNDNKSYFLLSNQAYAWGGDMWGHDIANLMFHAGVCETSLVNDVSICQEAGDQPVSKGGKEEERQRERQEEEVEEEEEEMLAEQQQQQLT